MDLDTLDDTGFQLVLPSGAKIGHRSLLRLAYVNILWGMKGGVVRQKRLFDVIGLI